MGNWWFPVHFPRKKATPIDNHLLRLRRASSKTLPQPALSAIRCPPSRSVLAPLRQRSSESLAESSTWRATIGKTDGKTQLNGAIWSGNQGLGMEANSTRKALRFVVLGEFFVDLCIFLLGSKLWKSQNRLGPSSGSPDARCVGEVHCKLLRSGRSVAKKAIAWHNEAR